MHQDSNVLPNGQAPSAATAVVDGDRLTWTIPEAAEKLGVSTSYYYRAANKGELPARRLGRRWVVPKKALRELLESGPATAAEQHRGGEVA
jgi:excisionase family DNA binding protein